jgi:hypothetical protein
MGEIVVQMVSVERLGAWVIGWLGRAGAVKAKRFSHADSVMPVWATYQGKSIAGQLVGARSRRIGDVPAGVWPRPQNYMRFIRRLTIRIPCSDRQERDYYDFIVSQIGSKYDWKAILAFVFNRDWRILGTWICSELVAAGLERVRVFPYRLFLDANKIDPDTLVFGISAVTPVWV